MTLSRRGGSTSASSSGRLSSSSVTAYVVNELISYVPLMSRRRRGELRLHGTVFGFFAHILGQS